MGLFPAYIENSIQSRTMKNRVIPKEYGIDFETGQLTGKIVAGLEAIKVWIWLVLQTPRYRYYIYTWDYGNEFENLIGQGYTEEHIESEAKRMTEECLIVNKNIQGITKFNIKMTATTLTVSFTVETIYGNIEFQDQAIARPTA